MDWIVSLFTESSIAHDVVVYSLVIALGVLLGIAVPARKKKASAWAASLVFVAAYVPLMAKFLPYLLGGQVAIEDIYGEKQL